MVSHGTSDAASSSGNTALHIAALRGRADRVHEPVAIGKSPRFVNKNHLNVNGIANRFGYDTVDAIIN